MKIKPIRFVFILIFSFIFSACGSRTNDSAKDMGFEISPIFREFYQNNGGEELLGKAIGSIFKKNDQEMQYVVAGLLVSDPFSQNGKSIYFADLGNQLGYYEPPHTEYESLDGTFLNGYEIYKDFVGLYTKLGGIDVVGYPISNANYNTDKEQIEQHFENLGFYAKDGKDGLFVGLLPYGRIDCGSVCSLSYFESQPTIESTIETILVPEPFASAVATLGKEMVGQALTGIYDAGDGNVQIIFENAVLFTTVGNEDEVKLLPISTMLGHAKSEPMVLQDSSAAYFYRVNGNLGYSIPNSVFEFLMNNGGFETFGIPIQSVEKIEEYHYRQCFDNLCLEILVDPTTKEESVIPLALGRDYFEKIYEAPEEIIIDNTLELTIWMASPLVSRNSEQTVFAQLTNEKMDSLDGWELKILIIYPSSGEQEELFFPLTDSDGLTEIKVGPIDADNGSRIRYEVCLKDGSLCKEGKYTIWSE